MQFAIGLGARRIEAGEGIQLVTLEVGLGLAREGQFDAEIGRALGDQRLGREQGIDAELDPALALGQLLFQQGVEHMVARIALVAAQIQGAADIDRQVGVDLDQAVGPALVPVVAAPRLLGDERQVELLARRQLDVLLGLGLAGGDAGLHHRLELVGGDDVAVLEGVDAGGQLTLAGDQLVDARQDRVVALQRLQRRADAEQAFGLVLEAELHSVQHGQARLGCPDLALQERLATDARRATGPWRARRRGRPPGGRSPCAGP
jgi:hypothetical protein